MEEEEQDVTAKLDPDLEGGREEGGVPTNIIRLRDPIMATALCSAQEAEKEGGMGQQWQEGRGMKGKERRARYPIATNMGEIAQIACFAQHDT